MFDTPIKTTKNLNFDFIHRAMVLNQAAREIELMPIQKDEIDELVRQNAIKMMRDRSEVLYIQGVSGLNVTMGISSTR